MPVIRIQAKAFLKANRIRRTAGKSHPIANDIRGLLRNFSLKVGLVGKIKFEERINELVEHRPDLHEIMQPLLAARKMLRDEFTKLHKKVLDLVARMKFVAD